jgi:hypothetical protein
MGDVFVEHMVQQTPTNKLYMKKGLYAVTAAVVGLLPWMVEVFLGIPISMLLPMSVIGAGWGVVILCRRLDLEFEYIVTNGEMDVDKIIGRRSRKRMFTVDCRIFDILAPLKPEYSSEYESQTITNVIDVSSGPNAPDCWFAIFNAKDGARTLLVFEPNEKMLEAFRRYIRGKVKS